MICFVSVYISGTDTIQYTLLCVLNNKVYKLVQLRVPPFVAYAFRRLYFVDIVVQLAMSAMFEAKALRHRCWVLFIA